MRADVTNDAWRPSAPSPRSMAATPLSPNGAVREGASIEANAAVRDHLGSLKRLLPAQGIVSAAPSLQDAQTYRQVGYRGPEPIALGVCSGWV
jgi:hypothetical protein